VICSSPCLQPRQYRKCTSVSETGIEDFLDLNRYPINSLDRCMPILTECQKAIAKDGFCALPGFLSEKGISSLLKEGKDNFKSSRTHFNSFNIWNENPRDFEDSKKYGAKHLRRKSSLYHSSIITSDILDNSSLLCRLHTWDAFTRFAALATAPADSSAQPPPLYPLADELGARVVRILGEGNRLSWRFAPFALEATLVLQSPTDSSGGGGGELDVIAANVHGMLTGESAAAAAADGVTALLDAEDVLRELEEMGIEMTTEEVACTHNMLAIVGDYEGL
jgi:hypothetical protein